MRCAKVEYSLSSGKVFDVSVLKVRRRVGVVLQTGSFIFILDRVLEAVRSEEGL